MTCYLCGQPIADDAPFYNDHGQQVCKPCFLEAKRCFICRFPGRKVQEVPGLGGECEFCRGNVVAEGSPVLEALQPLQPFLERFGSWPALPPRFAWVDRLELRAMQTQADLPPDQFMDDFLRFCYPVYYQAGTYHLLRRMAKPTFAVHAIIQLASAQVAQRFDLAHLGGNTPFHTMARGFCHWLGYQAAGLLKYDVEKRQLRKWPELGAQGDFARWELSAQHMPPAKVVAQFRAELGPAARKYLPQRAP